MTHDCLPSVALAKLHWVFSVQMNTDKSITIASRKNFTPLPEAMTVKVSPDLACQTTAIIPRDTRYVLYCQLFSPRTHWRTDSAWSASSSQLTDGQWSACSSQLTDGQWVVSQQLAADWLTVRGQPASSSQLMDGQWVASRQLAAGRMSPSHIKVLHQIINPLTLIWLKNEWRYISYENIILFDNYLSTSVVVV